MRIKFYLFTAFFIFCLALKSFGQCKEIVGYYPNWQWYDRAQLVNPATIDYSRYTIINYAFFSPQTDGSINSTDAWADENLLLGQPDWQNGGYLPNTSIVDLAHNSGVEVLPSIGGWTLSDNFPAIAASATTRTAFANACVNLITQYNFDGIDLDWEYPGYAPHNGTPADKQNFTLLLQDLRAALNNLTTITGKTYKITAALGAAPSHMNNIEWTSVSNLLDIINLMSYDFFGVWDGYNNHNSPLYAPTQGDPQFNLDAAFTNLTTTYGVPANKITLGVAFYGRSATGSTALFAPNSGSANTTLFADDEGTPLYYNILPILNQFNENWDSQAQTSYLSGISNNTFVSYDNELSIEMKANYIVNSGAAGAIVWEITGDYIETSPGSGVIAGTPLADKLNAVFCGGGNTNINPTVNITNPTNNTTLTVATTVTLTALANDSDGTIASVIFNIDGQNLTGILNNGNYEATWTPQNTGSFPISATAMDNENATATNTISVTVDSLNQSQPPIISFANPTNGAVLTEGNINLQATATDADGTVSTVIFTIDNQNIPAAANGNSWSANWAAIAGNYTLTATATDNDGLTAMATISVIVQSNGGGGTGEIIGTYIIVSDWGTGYCADVTLTNNGTTTINGWTLTFDLPSEITSLWNTGIWSGSAATGYTAEDAGWNGTIAPNETVDFGFCANEGLQTITNAFLNGIQVDFGGNPPVLDPPTVTILSPNDDDVLSQGNIILDADANDADGNIISVIFEIDGQNYPATLNNGFWSTTWNADITGTFSINVTATDNDGLTGTDNISVTIENNTPSGDISGEFIIGSDWGTGYCAEITLTNNSATAINGWTFYFETDADITSLWNGNYTGSQADGYTVENLGWNGTIETGGSVTFGYCADYNGNFSPPTNANLNGIPITFGTTPPTTNNPPTISIISPTDNTNFEIGTPININAVATDVDGTVTSVIFEINGQLISGSNNGNNWAATWTPNAIGNYNILATATDDDSDVSTTSVTLIIEDSASNNIPPTVNITSPSNGANLLLGAGITLISTASDADGSVTDVIFNINGQTLNTTGTGANYQAVWNPPGIGTYSIFATATDNEGATSTTSILVTVLDDSSNNDLTLGNLPLQITFNEGETVTYTFNQPITEVLTRNLYVIDIIVNGNDVTLTGLHSGRTGLRIKSGGNNYFIGCRVNHTDGSIPGMPDYLSVGSVSEDTAGDLAFWEGVETGQMNKSMDIRYIYINGGPINGWQSWGPNRPESFATESLRYGLIPYFIYYNIPDGGESYTTDLAHVNDVTYMNAYFADLNLFLDKVQSVLQGEFYGIILEPDFLGYMQQNANPNDPELITTCVNATTIAPDAGNIRTLVERINNTINIRRSQGHFFTYGWQLNLWSYPIEGAPHGIIRISDELGFAAGRAEIRNAAEQTALYAIQSGCLSSQADFISIDKYGLDAMATAGGSADPYDATWFFNNDHWNNYLYYANTLYNTTSLPVVLWQLPVGHINNSQYVSAYTGAQFPPLPNTNTKWEDSSTSFFLGDDFEAFDDLRLNYFSQNMYNDPNVKVIGNMVTYADHMEAVKNAGIISVFFGAGVGASTDGVGDAPTDDYFWIQKVQDYYINGPVPLDLTMFQNCSSGCPPNVSFSSPEDDDEMVLTALSPIDITVLAWDQDGHLSNLTVQVDGQTIALDTAGFFHDATWMPSDFGTYMMTVTATDNDQMTTTETIIFTIIEFDPMLCGIDLWNTFTVYNTVNTQVTWDGSIYENQWWTQEDEPGAGGQWDVWNYVAPCVLPDDSPVNPITNTLPSEQLETVKLNVYPNPTSGATRLKFVLQEAGLTQISVFNEIGQLVAMPVDEMLESGIFEVKIKEKELVEGVYFVELISGGARVMRQVLVIK
jgi:GH18 family chitinase